MKLLSRIVSNEDINWRGPQAERYENLINDRYNNMQEYAARCCMSVKPNKYDFKFMRTKSRWEKSALNWYVSRSAVFRFMVRNAHKCLHSSKNNHFNVHIIFSQISINSDQHSSLEFYLVAMLWAIKHELVHFIFFKAALPLFDFIVLFPAVISIKISHYWLPYFFFLPFSCLRYLLLKPLDAMKSH